jgi:hypothetical protein
MSLWDVLRWNTSEYPDQLKAASSSLHDVRKQFESFRQHVDAFCQSHHKFIEAWSNMASAVAPTFGKGLDPRAKQELGLFNSIQQALIQVQQEMVTKYLSGQPFLTFG